MKNSHIQMLLAKCGFYTGRIDGIVGPRTWVSVKKAEQSGGYSTARWSKKRKLVGAAQSCLNALGFQAGTVDGYEGHNTKNALESFLHAEGTGTKLIIKRPDSQIALGAQVNYPRQRDLEAFYGPAGGPDCTAGKVMLPFPFVIAWNKRQRVSRFSCHKLVAEPMTAIFRDAAEHYGENRYRELNLDVFGGCYNFRKMRGGSKLSTHAYGIAVDLNPEQNRLKWGEDRAQFARPEYQPFWEIVVSHGGVPAGYAWGKDWMHFQFARL